MARYTFLMYYSEDWHDTVDEQGVADEIRLARESQTAAYDEALDRTTNPVERRFLARRRGEV